jgi:hypothetical protein
MRYANITSSLALFVALGGTGYAALKLPKNSVHAKQIAAGAVRSSEVKNHSLKPVDFATVPQGAQGAQGAQGPKGDKGDPGAPGRDAVLATGSDSTANDLDISALNTSVDSHLLRVILTTTATARILATATMTLKDTVPDTTLDDARCKISLDDPPPSLATGTPISQEIFAALPANSGTTHTDLAVTGRSAQLPAGTYYVTLHCLAADDGATFDAGDLTVMAVAD